ncbi:Metallo-dependent phosphatase-like protein [Massariosphaeria phaeospora]|uniref:Endopolyphosphatase n=1 Tax=Massariosphaeria phaeospora TaxID=100035 RepID=A0A7C8M135_9PLEO|nr:Metallo-dependent phosphatase-like protein [Massariosphaeria phaeospora]
MLHARPALIVGLCALQQLLGVCAGQPAGTASLDGQSTRRLKGRFLHITDFHPDPFYKTYSSTEEEAACHRQRGPAGFYGAETSACDSPVSLVNETFRWIHDHIRDDIDFVVWTGDSARHDNDEKLPRTQAEIIQQNEFLVTKFAEVFGSHGGGHALSTHSLRIPVVPTFGNNDIMPHNIFLNGPNKWTKKYLDIWRSFIPEEQRHQFQQGGWFHVEVIPGQLAVISLNTMYFFASNSGVDGCANKHEPGYEHMEWLRVQLQILRDRGMKAILMGHVPPARVESKESWDETCWQKYTLWQRQYRDVIVGSLYGHMNIDHFMLQDFKQLKKSTKRGEMASIAKPERVGLLEDGEVTVASASGYLLDLRQAWAKLPVPTQFRKRSLSDHSAEDAMDHFSTWQWIISKLSISNASKKVGKGHKKKYIDKIGGKYAERYSVTHVSPSVVPNYFPTLRIFEYNITGLEDLIVPIRHSPKIIDHPSTQLPISSSDFGDDADWEREIDLLIRRKQKRKEKESRKKPKKYKFKIPNGPSKSAPPGPAYSPQPLTLTGYVQYFANLTHINNDFVEGVQSVTTENEDAPRTIFGLAVDGEKGEIEANKWKEGKHGKHQGKKPRPKPHPKAFGFEVEYDTKADKAGGLRDLTVRSYVDLARRIGRGQSATAGYGVEEEEELDEMNADDLYDSDIEEGSDDEEEEEEEEEEEDTDQDTKNNKKKKHHKGKKHRKHKHGRNSAWFTFVKRAFVGTMDPADIEELFGREGGAAEDEGMEL